MSAVLSELDRLEIRYSTLFHNTIDARNSPWSVTRHWKEATHAAGREVLAERRKRGMACGVGCLIVALRKHRLPLDLTGGVSP